MYSMELLALTCVFLIVFLCCVAALSQSGPILSKPFRFALAWAVTTLGVIGIAEMLPAILFSYTSLAIFLVVLFFLTLLRRARRNRQGSEGKIVSQPAETNR